MKRFLKSGKKKDHAVGSGIGKQVLTVEGKKDRLF